MQREFAASPSVRNDNLLQEPHGSHRELVANPAVRNETWLRILPIVAAAVAVRCRWSLPLPLQAATAAAAADGSAVCFFMGSHLFGRLGQK